MSRPKDFATWSAERQERWREEKRKIARKSYAKHSEERRRKVRLYKASIRGTVLVEDARAQKRVRRPAIKMCTGCSNTMEYKLWEARGRLCKSCKAKALSEKKRREHLRRRFYKLVAAHGCYGKMDLREVVLNSDVYDYACDFHQVETVASHWMGDVVKAYVRTTDEHRRGRPDHRYPYGEFRREIWSDWLFDAYRARRDGEAAAALRARDRLCVKLRNLAKQRRASKAREARLKREAEKAEKRKAALECARKASLRRAKKKEKARKARLEAARVAGLRRGKLSKEVPFFQMMVGAESIVRYVEQQTTDNRQQ